MREHLRNLIFSSRADAASVPTRLAVVCALALCVLYAAGGAAPARAQDGGAVGSDKDAKPDAVKRPPALNVRLFEDLARYGKGLFDQGRLGPDTTLDVSADAELNDDGTFKLDTVKVEGLPADEDVARLAQQFITALSQSKVLSVLEGAKGVRLALRLDRQNVSVKMASVLQSEENAARYAAGYGTLLDYARRSKEGTEEGELYKGLKVINDGKQFILSFEMPKDAAGKIIADLLAKKAAAARGKN